MPGLEDLYREIILDHYRNPRNRGELETPPAHRVEGFNPLCGDEIVLYLDLDADGRVADIRIAGVSPMEHPIRYLTSLVKAFRQKVPHSPTCHLFRAVGLAWWATDTAVPSKFYQVPPATITQRQIFFVVSMMLCMLSTALINGLGSFPQVPGQIGQQNG